MRMTFFLLAILIVMECTGQPTAFSDDETPSEAITSFFKALGDDPTHGFWAVARGADAASIGHEDESCAVNLYFFQNGGDLTRADQTEVPFRFSQSIAFLASTFEAGERARAGNFPKDWRNRSSRLSLN